MKKMLSILLTACIMLSACFISGFSVNAEEFTENGFKYTVTNNEATITGATSGGSSLVIPSTLGGYTVTSIGKRAFAGQRNITSVSLPNSIITIENEAFNYCTNLKSIEIPNSVKYIGTYAFSIDRDGLMGTDEDILDYTTDLYITDLKAWCEIEFGCDYYGIINNVFYNGEPLSGNIVIPTGTTKINPFSFSFTNNDNITGVTIPETVTSIGDSAFKGCSSLTNIKIPNSVSSIGDSAFEGCTGLTNIEIPNSVTSIEGWAFYYCTGLTNIEIPNSVTSIESGAFYGCTGLTSITIPESVVDIGYSAFSDCTAIKDVWYSCANRANLTIDSYNTNLLTAKWHFNTCAEHTYSGDCDTTCNNCEWVRTTQVEHSFGGECATTCDNCDYTKTANYEHRYTLNSGLTCSGCKNSKAPSAPSLINVTDSSVTLVAVTGCEYSKDGINWQSSNIFNNLNPNTSYTFYQRVAKSQTSNLGPSSAGATFTTTARLAGDLNGDSMVTLEDVVLLAQYVAGWNVTLK